MKKWIFFLALISAISLLIGCDLIGGKSGDDTPKVTINLSENYLSKYEIFTFSGTCDNVNYVKLKIGNDYYDAVVNPGEWSVQINLANIGIGKDIQVTAFGYKYKGSTTPDVQSETELITIHNYKNSTDNNNPYGYVFIDDVNYDGNSAELTGLAKSDNYLYVSGYYYNSTSVAPFVYRFDPVLGVWDKKKVWDWIVTTDKNPVSVVVGNNKVYVAYTIPSENAYIKVLDLDLNEAAYSYSNASDSLGVFRAMYYKDGYLYITGDNNSGTNPATLGFKIQDLGDSFDDVNSIIISRDPYYNGSHGYDITVDSSGKIYIAAEYLNSVWYGVVYGFFNDFTHDSDTNSISSAEVFGIDYSASVNRLYATGVYQDADPQYGTLFMDELDPDLMYDNWLGHHFQQSLYGDSFYDETGYGIIYDSDNGYTVIVGYGNATAAGLVDAEASICVRNGASEVKTVDFVESGYAKSVLKRIVKDNGKYYAVGYAEDSNGFNLPMVIFTDAP